MAFWIRLVIFRDQSFFTRSSKVLEFHGSQFTHILWAERFQIKNQNIFF